MESDDLTLIRAKMLEAFDPTKHGGEEMSEHAKVEVLTQRIKELEDALIKIRDATHTSAIVLRGFADPALQKKL